MNPRRLKKSPAHRTLSELPSRLQRLGPTLFVCNLLIDFYALQPSDGPGALSIDAMCQDGGFAMDNIAFYSDARLATELTAEADWKRRGLYIGPQVHWFRIPSPRNS